MGEGIVLSIQGPGSEASSNAQHASCASWTLSEARKEISAW